MANWFEKILPSFIRKETTKKSTIPEGLWLSETLNTISAQTGYDIAQLENSLTSGQVVSKYPVSYTHLTLPTILLV